MTQFARLRDEIQADEGRRLDVYKDTLGFLTVGVGHKVLGTEGLKLGDRITPAQCAWLLEQDLIKTLNLCALHIKGWDGFPEEVQHVLANMAFQLGISGLLKFKDTLALIQAREYKKASLAMLDSLWAHQTPARAGRLSARMLALAVCPACHRPL